MDTVIGKDCCTIQICSKPDLDFGRFVTSCTEYINSHDIPSEARWRVRTLKTQVSQVPEIVSVFYMCMDGESLVMVTRE